jgi:hypothetical protein
VNRTRKVRVLVAKSPTTGKYIAHDIDSQIVVSENADRHAAISDLLDRVSKYMLENPKADIKPFEPSIRAKNLQF